MFHGLQAHLWQADAWQAAWGEAIVEGFHACLTQPDSAECTVNHNRTVLPAPQHEYRQHHRQWQEARGIARPKKGRQMMHRFKAVWKG